MTSHPPCAWLWAIALVLLSHQTACAQNIDPIGSPNTLEVATWNIEWFGSTTDGPSNDALQLENARTVIASADIDLWAVQEISRSNAFDDLVEGIGDNYEGQLASNSGTQRIGFIYNTDVIRIRQIRHVLESDEQFFAFRPPLQMEADVMLADTTVIVTFIVVHMKATAELDSYNSRTTASSRLKTHIDFTSLDTKNVIVLGDFNDRLTRSIFAGRTSPYNNFLQDTEDYEFLSYPLELEGFGSFCSNSACTSTGQMIDHIMITDELFNTVPSGTRAAVLEQAADAIFSFGASTSDHLPVYARFDFMPTVTSSEDDAVLPTAFLNAPFPNPALSSTQLRYRLDAPSHIAIRVYDITGREVMHVMDRLQPPGEFMQHINLSSLAPSTYYIRFLVDNVARTFPVTLTR